MKISQETQYKRGIAGNYNNIGRVYDKQGNCPEALKNYLAALKINEETGNKNWIVINFNNLGSLHTKLKKYSEARKYHEDALSLSTSIGAKELIKSSYNDLAMLDSATANWKGAYEHYKLFVLYRDSLNNEETREKSTQTKMQYEFDKKQSEVKAEQDKKDAITALESKRHLQQKYLLILGLILALGFAFWDYRQKKRITKEKKHSDALNLELQKTLGDLRATQSQLVQQEKLASLGALTAGIAHEIKNPLNFVTNFSELSNELLEELKESKDDKEKTEIIETLQGNLVKINEHGKRADAIVKSMLEHSRTGTGEKQATDLNKLCEEYLNLAYHGMRANVRDFKCTVIKELSPGLPPIAMVQQDIARVILNIINNAFYALKDKADASFSISTEFIKQNKPIVKIRLKDNGTGIPEHIKQKIFEPFFTTKPTGEGTGLGLSLSFDIIKAHGGTLEVESGMGKGTEFIIILPA